MMLAEVAAFDNLEGLAQMGSDLAAYVRRAAIEGVAAHEAEEDIWQRILAMGRQAFGQFLAAQGDGDVGETIVPGSWWNCLSLGLRPRFRQPSPGLCVLAASVKGALVNG